jgi:hypothetical protein
MPETPISDSAARTSSSLNGLMIAVTSFMSSSPSEFRCFIYIRKIFAGYYFAAFVPRTGAQLNH